MIVPMVPFTKKEEDKGRSIFVKKNEVCFSHAKVVIPIIYLQINKYPSLEPKKHQNYR